MLDRCIDPEVHRIGHAAETIETMSRFQPVFRPSKATGLELKPPSHCHYILQKTVCRYRLRRALGLRSCQSGRTVCRHVRVGRKPASNARVRRCHHGCSEHRVFFMMHEQSECGLKLQKAFELMDRLEAFKVFSVWSFMCTAFGGA